MPMVSEKQRRLFHAAKKNADIRKRHGMKKKMVDKAVAHDEGGKLPMRANMKNVERRDYKGETDQENAWREQTEHWMKIEHEQQVYRLQEEKREAERKKRRRPTSGSGTSSKVF